MCRLLGMSYGPERRPEVLSTGQIASVLFRRLEYGGPHAFGWMQYGGGQEPITVRKYPGRVSEQLQKLQGIRRECEWFIGHVRYATHGSPSNNINNHPVRHDNIIGVHNGVLRNHANILKVTGREDDSCQVDSEAIFAAVNKWGPKEGLARVYGSMVTFFVDVRDPSIIYLGRSNQRDIRIGKTDRGNLIWASDGFALDELARRGIKFVGETGVRENRLVTIREGQFLKGVTYREPVPQIDFSTRPVQQNRKDRKDRLGTVLANMAVHPADRFPKPTISEWRRPHHNEYTRPDPKPVRGSKVREVPRVVSEDMVRYGGVTMTVAEFTALMRDERERENSSLSATNELTTD